MHPQTITETIAEAITAASPYPLTAIRYEGGHIYATLSRPMVDGMADFTFALSQQELEQAHDPEAIIAAHVKIAAAELAARENSKAALVWA